MKTLPLLQQRTLQAIFDQSKKSLPPVAVRALLAKGLITDKLAGDYGLLITEEGKKALNK